MYSFAWTLISRTIREFIADQCFRKAAAMAYYVIFALPMSLLIAIAIAGAAFDERAVRGKLDEQLRDHFGPAVADQVEAMIINMDDPRTRSTSAGLIGLAGFLFGATAAFTQLQHSLNETWGVKPGGHAVKNWLLKRLLSMLLLVMLGSLLLFSMVASAALSVFSAEFQERWLMDGIDRIFEWLNNFVSLGLLTVFIALIFKIVPDRGIRWRQVWAGAFFTAVLFVLGKYGVAMYVAQTGRVDAYGAAGSLALLLLWVYYSSLILFLGAELTHNWAVLRSESDPKDGEASEDSIKAEDIP